MWDVRWMMSHKNMNFVLDIHHSCIWCHFDMIFVSLGIWKEHYLHGKFHLVLKQLFWKVSFANMGKWGATLIFTRLLANQHLCWWIHILPTHMWYSVMPSTPMECHTFWIFVVIFEHELQKWKFVFHEKVHSQFMLFKGWLVATLALGLQPRQGLAKVRAKSELGSHISCSRECKRVWGNEPHTPKWAPTLGVGVLMNSQIFRRRL
jgi:hypothetical protein